LDLFLVSLLLLFLELACIRWFPAHVLFLTFFTNFVLLACFLGMSLGLLTARRRTDFLGWTPALLTLALGAGLLVEGMHGTMMKSLGVGNRATPEVVYFGTELPPGDVARFYIPIEALGAIFFVLLALVFVGPGQELGRAFDRVPDRLRAYTLNVLGSLVGIGLFALCSWAELPPVAWFGPGVLGLAYFLYGNRVAGQKPAPGSPLSALRSPLVQLLCLVLAVVAASVTTGPFRAGSVRGEFYWSPYYRIDYARETVEGEPRRQLAVNQIGHQQMQGRDRPFPAYALPHLLNRDTGPPACPPPLALAA